MSALEFVTRPSATLVKESASDDDVALAAWVSFAANEVDKLEDRGRVGGLINFLMRENHNSPFEHSTFTFWVDCPLNVRSEYHRHRTAAYNEVSGRYTVMKPRFYVPGDERPVVQQGKAGAYYFVPDAEKLSEAQEVIKIQSESAWNSYQSMLEKGIAKEVARTVLPTNLMTQFYATMNARNLMNFLGLRTDKTALYEIRLVAGDMEDIFAKTMPLTYRAWQTRQEEWALFQEWRKSNVPN